VYALTLLALLAQTNLTGPSRLAVIRAAPDFTLTRQDGKPFQFKDLRGKVVLVSFVFTTCSGSCPATTHRLSQTAQVFKDKGLLQTDRVRFVTITLDPTRDTPEALRKYMKLYDADPAYWSFLTGEKEKVETVHAAWGMWAKPAANSQLDHPSRVFLLDSRGRIREIYNLDYLKPDWVLADVQLLLQEDASGAKAKGSGRQ
jgi:protein SCO1/2